MLVSRSSYAVKCSYTVKHQQGKDFCFLFTAVSPLLSIMPGTCSENIVDYRLEIYIDCKPIADTSYCPSAYIYEKCIYS